MFSIVIKISKRLAVCMSLPLNEQGPPLLHRVRGIMEKEPEL